MLAKQQEIVAQLHRCPQHIGHCEQGELPLYFRLLGVELVAQFLELREEVYRHGDVDNS